MILAHYAHRLPADHDLGAIRDRARRRGPLWDETADLYFKTFLLREAGAYGARANAYASIYLWRDPAALRDLLSGPRFEAVIGSFGRPSVDVRIALAAWRGPADAARFAWVKDTDIAVDADIAAACAAEAEEIRVTAARPDAVAAVGTLDASRWRIKRVVLTSDEPEPRPGREIHQVLHLARPLLDHLPRS